MSQNVDHNLSSKIDEIYQSESRRVFATLVRLLKDFDLAEEALHEAFSAAIEKWPIEGIPQNPRSWLVSTGRFKAIDRVRRESRMRSAHADVVARLTGVKQSNDQSEEQEIGDDRLRLIFTCCHPAIDPKVQVPLTLREVCGLTTEEIASAFLTSPPTMAQRIVRGKAKVRDAGIPYIVPSVEDLPERLDAVLNVIYLVFNEGYSASAGESVLRVDLSDEAIRLTRLVLELIPDPEVEGLLALMLLHESRRTARVDESGDVVLLEDQDRSQWNQSMIQEGTMRVQRALSSGNFGVYSLQAAISAVHANAATSAETNWDEIVSLYDLLLANAPSPVVELNQAVAVSMRDGPEAGIRIIDEIFDRGELLDYHLAYAARGELLRRQGKFADALETLQKALARARQEPERRLLQKRITEVTAVVQR